MSEDAGASDGDGADVRVRAVVMTRDDSSGGWVPLGGGGLSHVVIRKGRSHDSRGRREYIICGERLRDRAPVLECAVQRGLVYNKVNPIFHHWRVEDRKFGLTFQSPADAISFEKGLQAVIDKLDGGSDSPSSSTPEEADTEDDGQAVRSESSSNSRKEMLPKPITIVTSESSSTCFVRYCKAAILVVFGFKLLTSVGVLPSSPLQIHTRPGQHQLSQMAAVLNPPVPPPPPPAPPTPPVGPPASSPLSPLSPTISLLEEGDLRSVDPCKDLWGSRGYEDYRRAGATRTMVGGLTGGVVVGAKPPSVCPRPRPRASSSCSSRCMYCRSVFSASENGRGRCRDAPDPALHCLRQWTCVWCAESLLYHCMSDSEGEFWEPCSCDDSMGGHPHPLCCARWLALLALSLFVPCMCCYLPLRACLRCGERCGCCGGKHKAVR
uniref:Sprouty related EVH1 domain containing 3 n=1 Tax=Tetraodon nigroviridis TaxID=99883 RepID=H3C131_TETNG